ncbi:MAG TPA: hypothetical protein VFM16_08710 [Holophagaceae bacterium]|nr:hypothetical protein [Holophagaceae bacterium]
MQSITTWLIFILAAAFEVGGDALIRKGLRSSGIGLVISGFLVLGAYGLVVNLVKWDFSRLLGVYVAVFAVFSILVSRILFKEHIPAYTLLGLLFIVLGGLIIQFGPRFSA